MQSCFFSNLDHLIILPEKIESQGQVNHLLVCKNFSLFSHQMITCQQDKVRWYIVQFHLKSSLKLCVALNSMQVGGSPAFGWNRYGSLAVFFPYHYVSFHLDTNRINSFFHYMLNAFHQIITNPFLARSHGKLTASDPEFRVKSCKLKRFQVGMEFDVDFVQEKDISKIHTICNSNETFKFRGSYCLSVFSCAERNITLRFMQ